MKSLHPDVSTTCGRADIGLWSAYARSHHGDASGSPTGKLVFLEDRSGAPRVSEQEARFAFVEAMCSGPLRYSVEAPTRKQYQFTGRSSRSAQTDLAIHDVAGARICNVEFKAKGLRLRAQRHFHIYKDLQKLLREPLWGLWFHLLGAAKNSTVNDLLCVMARKMNEVRDHFGADVETPGLTIHICVLRHGFSIQRDVVLAGAGNPTAEELGRMLRIDLDVSRSELRSVSDPNGWTLNSRKAPSHGGP